MTTLDERERRLIEAVVALARSLTEERERLARRLAEVERELNALAGKVERARRPALDLGAPRPPRD